uniref:Phosphate-specific transport system accessory protein PhoU n=1 Tax=Magnetococcus massalia (strain MO-1) TaxID=451514 RepID=A0A1S7LGE3_MAGMO|nr:Putative Phosphate transport system protein PhoU. putative phosphate uptake regulator, PhoU. (phoU) [Candidatus Magnetococcus massalia]
MNARLAEHTHKAVDSDLSGLEHLINEMSTHVAHQLRDLTAALRSWDADLAKQIALRDDNLNAMDEKINHQAMRFIALRQPVAVDLRTAVAAMRMSKHLERMGDYTKNIAERLQTVSNNAPSCPTDPLIKMSSQLLKATEDAMDAFNTRDVGAALRVWSGDEELDTLYNGSFSQMVNHMMEHVKEVPSMAHLLFIARDMERLGDHLTDVVEDIYFMIVGEPVREPRPMADITTSMMVG